MCWTFFWHGVEQSYDHHSRWLGTTTSKKNEHTHTHTKRMQRDRKVSLLSVQLNLLYIMCVYVSCISNEIPFYLFIHFAICTHKRGSTVFFLFKRRRRMRSREKKNGKHYKIVGFKRHFNLIQKKCQFIELRWWNNMQSTRNSFVQIDE